MATPTFAEQEAQQQESTETTLSAISETYTSYSPLPPGEVLDWIKTSTGKFSSPTGNGGPGRFRGMVKGNRFTIIRLSAMRNPFARHLTGEVFAADQGSRIDYSLSINPVVRGMFGMWFGLVTVVLLAGLSTLITAGSGEARYELIVVPIVLLACAVGLVSLGLSSGQKGESEYDQFLHKLSTMSSLRPH